MFTTLTAAKANKLTSMINRGEIKPKFRYIRSSIKTIQLIGHRDPLTSSAASSLLAFSLDGTLKPVEKAIAKGDPDSRYWLANTLRYRQHDMESTKLLVKIWQTYPNESAAKVAIYGIAEHILAQTTKELGQELRVEELVQGEEVVKLKTALEEIKPKRETKVHY